MKCVFDHVVFFMGRLARHSYRRLQEIGYQYAVMHVSPNMHTLKAYYMMESDECNVQSIII